nr:hypothetical protein [Natronorubrum halalkaliphilum]
MSVSILAERVASRRHRIPTGTISDDKVDRAQVRLVHQHFPRLISHDIIAVDWTEERVSLVDTEDVDCLLTAAAELERWPPDGLLEQPEPSS